MITINRRTFEILAKWIADTHGIKVEFKQNCPGPQVNMKTKTIELPLDIKEANVFAALAQLMHEAAHIKHSAKIPPSKGPIEHSIINAIEDIRIDEKNMALLPNIRDFYHRMIKDLVHPKKAEIAKESLMTRCLINCILILENFLPLEDPEAEKIIQQHSLLQLIKEATYDIEGQNWVELEKKVQKIMQIFGVKEPPSMQVTLTIGEGKSDGKDKGKDKEKGAGEGIEVNVDKFLHPKDIFGTGQGTGSLQGGSISEVGPLALQEQTKRAFTELLNLKEKITIPEGHQLNTDNLPALLTGEIEDLFKEEDVIRRKHSKILFLLDCSGSMSTPLLDNKYRKEVLIKAVKSMTNILDEIRETEGINIDYDVRIFDSVYHTCTKENWMNEMQSHSGGTDALNAFIKAQDEIILDQEIDGKKLIIMVTDGDVSKQEIEEIRKKCLMKNEDVRTMFIGIGADINKAFARDILGDNNILAEACAEDIIMEVIMQML